MRSVLALLTILALALPASAMAKRPEIQAHRGGPLVKGVPTYPENTLPAFRASAKAGFTLEMDVHLTKDGIPVVLHDGTLDRTTRCKGSIAEVTLADLQRRCKSDVIGAPEFTTFRHVKPRIPIPTLHDALAVAKRYDVRASVEINNYPAAGYMYDPSNRFVDREMAVVRRAHLPRQHVVMQSFAGAYLQRARHDLPRVLTSLLFLAAAKTTPEQAVAQGKTVGATYLSPPFPVSETYVTRAHEAGLKVVPFTIDSVKDIRAAARVGVDALITNDPVRARRALR